MKFDSAFYQFITSIVAMLCLLAITITGHDDKTEMISLFSAIMGAGLWGGMQARLPRRHGPGNGIDAPNTKGPDSTPGP